MKRITIVLLVIGLLSIFFVSCSLTDVNESENQSSESTSANESKEAEAKNKDMLDLTALSSTMIYSEVYNMMVTPEDYVGRKVKMKGQFAVYQNPETGENYYAAVIADATACCQQGLEFVLSEKYKYPEDYPQLGTEVVITGVFEIYKEKGFPYCHLVDAKLEISK